ncbi:hypothetical protein BHE74_00051497 [Ensete ventricosum]|nr:hypothetical protein BHE74_00051497 [Ensete ventricosum]
MLLLPARATDRAGKEIFREQRITRVKKSPAGDRSGLGEQHRTPKFSLFFSLFFLLRLILPEMAVPTIEIDRYRRQRLAMIEIDHYRPISSGNKAETAPIDDTAR